MAGQTGEIAPADKKLYALRDATATVPYIPLIVASIMSKKLAEDLDALVLDVKTGSGAFMQKYEDSVRLAEALVLTGKSFGVETQAVVSDMSQPLGKFVGNALEVYECIKLLRGEGDDAMSSTMTLSVELTARMLILGGVADTMESAESMIDEVLNSGRALAKFRQNVEVQGGDRRGHPTGSRHRCSAPLGSSCSSFSGRCTWERDAARLPQEWQGGARDGVGSGHS